MKGFTRIQKGWIYKRGKINPGWKKRYCILFSNGKILYFSDNPNLNYLIIENDKEFYENLLNDANGCVTLSSNSEISFEFNKMATPIIGRKSSSSLLKSKSENEKENELKSINFKISTSNRTFYFQTENIIEGKLWITSISNLISGTVSSMNSTFSGSNSKLIATFIDKFDTTSYPIVYSSKKLKKIPKVILNKVGLTYKNIPMYGIGVDMINKEKMNKPNSLPVEKDGNLLWEPDTFVFYEVLGEGNYGYVKRAVLNNGIINAAVKIVTPKTKTERKEIEVEYDALNKACHENIVAYYGMCITSSEIWIVMENCEYGSLGNLLDVLDCTFTENQIAFVLKQVFEGLNHLHNVNHTMHRDIKSDNILITSSLTLKLADFGVARMMKSKRGRTHSVIGTPHWVAPEIWADEKSGYSFSADVWSTGILAYEMAVGVPPLIDKNIFTLAEEYVTKKKEPRLPKDKEWSSNFEDFINKCLVNTPKDRMDTKQALEHPFLENTPNKDCMEDLLKRYKELTSDKPYKFKAKLEEKIESLKELEGSITSESTIYKSDLDLDYQSGTMQTVATMHLSNSAKNRPIEFLQ